MPALSHHDIQVTVTVTIKPRHEGVDVPVMISMGRIGRDNGTARGTVLKTRQLADAAVDEVLRLVRVTVDVQKDDSIS